MLELFFQFSKFFNIGINRKRFELLSTKDKLWAINNSKNTLFAILFYLLGSALLFTGLIESSKIKTNLTADFIIVFFVIHPIVGLLCLRQFLWLVNGKQELVIENGNLILRKKGTFFTKDKVYELNSVKNVRQAVDEDNLSLIGKIQLNISLNKKVLWRQTIGQVLFDYKYDQIKVFNDLNTEEKEQLTLEINNKKNDLATHSSTLA